MNLQKCENGHFYDADKYQTCPHCQQLNDDMRTVGKEAEVPGTPQPPVQPSVVSPVYMANDDAKTVGIFKKSFGTQPVTGWLVCIRGTAFGQSFPLKEGKNFIGRGTDMDIVLSGDKAVSRNRHACLIYEPKANVFYVQPGESHELFYRNDQVVLNSELLKSHDVLLIGETELLFVPLCGPDFNWESYKK